MDSNMKILKKWLDDEMKVRENIYRRRADIELEVFEKVVKMIDTIEFGRPFTPEPPNIHDVINGMSLCELTEVNHAVADKLQWDTRNMTDRS